MLGNDPALIFNYILNGGRMVEKLLAKKEFEKLCQFKTKLIALPLTKDELYAFYKSLPADLRNNIFKTTTKTLSPLSKSEILQIKGAYAELTALKRLNPFEQEDLSWIKQEAQEVKEFKDYLVKSNLFDRLDLKEKVETKEKVISADNVKKVILSLLAKQNIKFK